MPCLNGSCDLDIDYESIVGCMQGIIDNNRCCNFVFGGDFNLSKHQVTSNAYYMLSEFCSRNSIIWLDSSNGNMQYTFHADSVGHFSLLKNGACTNNAPSYVPPPQSPSTGESPKLLQKRSDITDVVHRTIKDMARRKCNVIISGLPEPAYHSEEDNKHADESAFFKLCEENLSVKPAITSRGCKRLGRYGGHRPRRMLVHLTSEASATSLLAMAKDLRQSTERRVAENVYINPDLTPEEAKAAYERRQRRRATTGIRRQLSHVPPADAATGALNSCMTLPTATDTVYNTCSTDDVAARSSAATSTSTATTATTSSSSASTGIDMSTGATNQPFRLDK